MDHFRIPDALVSKQLRGFDCLVVLSVEPLPKWRRRRKCAMKGPQSDPAAANTGGLPRSRRSYSLRFSGFSQPVANVATVEMVPEEASHFPVNMMHK